MLDKVKLGHSDLTADRLGGRAKPDNRSKFDEAVEWLRAKLEHGARRSSDLLKEAPKDGISERTLNRAKDSLKVSAHQKHPTIRGWVWELRPSCRGRMAI